ncbi:SRPBCC family protein [Gaiella occulta]|uniref:SRPBCC family protein n=1 Tax=Gaiella occulta TaxID=1002870 RepID=UPI0015F0BB76|nr:SRPBCC family protein [Gaiella occulta]
MTRVISESIAVHGTPEAVWAVAGDPGAIGEWVPALAESSYGDGERVCTTGDGAEIRERVLEHSDAEQSYTYEIVASPLPLRSYRSTLSVHGHGDHSHVTWEARFEALEEGQEPELEAMFSELYRDGLASLRERVEGAAFA